jgi:hypothetical protein
MNQAPVREDEAGIPYLEPDSEEPKTNPRIRVPLLLTPEPTGMVRLRAGVQYVQQALSRLKLAPAIVLGALLGSAPYLLEQHVRARVDDVVRASAAEPVQETSQLAAATPPPSQEPPAPLPPPSADDDEELTELSAPAPSPRFVRERSLLLRAKRQLRQGDGFGAQLALQRLDKRVPHGKLMRQRKLLEIEVLQALGAKAAARRAASEFAKAYPQSRELGKLTALLLGS